MYGPKLDPLSTATRTLTSCRKIWLLNVTFCQTYTHYHPFLIQNANLFLPVRIRGDAALPAAAKLNRDDKGATVQGVFQHVRLCHLSGSSLNISSFTWELTLVCKPPSIQAVSCRVLACESFKKPLQCYTVLYCSFCLSFLVEWIDISRSCPRSLGES